MISYTDSDGNWGQVTLIGKSCKRNRQSHFFWRVELKILNEDLAEGANVTPFNVSRCLSEGVENEQSY
jgi:hypothetical protein